MLEDVFSPPRNSISNSAGICIAVSFLTASLAYTLAIGVGFDYITTDYIMNERIEPVQRNQTNQDLDEFVNRY